MIGSYLFILSVLQVLKLLRSNYSAYNHFIRLKILQLQYDKFFLEVKPKK